MQVLKISFNLTLQNSESIQIWILGSDIKKRWTLSILDLDFANSNHFSYVLQILMFERDLVESPLGLPTISTLDVGRLKQEEDKRNHSVSRPDN